MKTILFTIGLPMLIRNFVRTGALARVARQHRVVLVAPFADNALFREDMRTENIECELLPMTNRLLGRLGSAMSLAAARQRLIGEYCIDTPYCNFELLRNTDWKRYAFCRVAKGLNWNQCIERLGESLMRSSWNANSACDELLDKYRPAMVVSTHPYLRIDWPLLFKAMQRSIPLVGIVHNWDNPTGRGQLLFPYQRVLAWSEHMKKEILRYNPALATTRVMVVGAPHHDLFYQRNLVTTRDEVFARLGLDPRRELITFAGCGTQTPHEHEPLRALVEAVANDRLKRPAQLWVRFYGDRQYEKSLSIVQDRPNVFWERASGEFWGSFRVERGWDNEIGFEQYLNLLAHSSVVVCGPSTVSIDAAMLDRPIVNYCYDGKADLSFPVSIRRHYFQKTHYQRVTCSGGVRLAFDDGELRQHVDEYLTDPAQDRAARRRLVHKICGPFDGRSCERLADALITTVHPERLAA